MLSVVRPTANPLVRGALGGPAYFRESAAEASLAARAAFRDIVEAALGESLSVHQAIKHVLDPGGLFNPGRTL